jgi:hypothetical protein
LGQQDIGESFHDWAGLFMMPLALGLLWLELFVLACLVVEEDDGQQLAVAGMGLRTSNPKQQKQTGRKKKR